MKVSRSGVIVGIVIAAALFVALALLGKGTARMAAEQVTSIGVTDSSAESTGSLLGGLEGSCRPADSIDRILRNRAFAPIDNGRLPMSNAQDNVAGQRTPAALPTRLRIPVIGVDARVIPVAQDSQHRLVVPYDISTVGWYEYGPAPGSTEGSCVMVAHRDGIGGGCGAFYELGQVMPGTRLSVTLDDGRELGYRVISREVVLKTEFARKSLEYFSTVGSPRLSLVTCGGDYVKEKGGYQSNIVITAIRENSP